LKLRTQLALTGTVLLVVAALVFAQAFSRLFVDSYQAHLAQHHKSLHRMLAQMLADRVIQGEVLDVTDILKDARVHAPSIAYLYVTDFEGRLFAHTFDAGFPRALLPTLQHTGGIEETNYFRTVDSTIEYYRAPLIEGLEATLYIGTHDAPLRRVLREMRQRIVLISIVLLIGGLVAWALLARRFTRPLARLVDKIKRYGGGETLDPTDIPVDGGSETRMLGRSMQQMVSNRNALAASLENSEAYLRQLFDASPIGLVLTRMDGSFLQVNRAFAGIIGRNVEETLTLSYWDITPADSHELEREQLAELEITGAYGPFEKEYLHNDGRRIPVRLLGRVIERAGERYIWSAVENISASRQLEALDRRLATILEHSFDEIYIFDDRLKFIQVSSGALANLGYSIDEIRSMGPVDLKPDFDAETFERLIGPLRKGERQQLVFETRHQRKDGSIYPVQVRLQASSTGSELTFFAIIVDVTEQKKAQEEIEKYQKHLEGIVEQRTRALQQQAQIIDQTHDSVVTTNLEGVVTSWNGGAEQLFGYSAAQAIGQHVAFVYPENEREFLDNEVLAPLKAHGRKETEVRMKRADGSIFPAHLSLSMLYRDTGEPTGMVSYCLDISQQKQREAELDRLTSRLQASNRELESFAYSVSHDLRAPLRAIDGFSLALAEDYSDKLDDTARDYLQRVRNGAQRMATLIDDMLQLSRVNRQELDAKPVDLSQIAREVMAELQESDPKRKVHMELEENMQVHGDPRLLRVMLDNLLGNAWKFTAREEISRISFLREPNHENTFIIRDNGVGFDMRYADKLFGAFQRLHRDVDFPGTGVGLATVQRIVHRHDGKVWADAKEGKGASFYFTLELKASNPAMEKITTGGTNDGSENAASG
jgi:PAS domain S-box-containing protein